MKRTFIKSHCSTVRPVRIPRPYVALGPSIRNGFNDGISDDTSPLLRNAYDANHNEIDPFYSFGNDVIGRDKFERSIKFEQMIQEAKTSSETTVKSEALASNNVNNNSEITE